MASLMFAPVVAPPLLLPPPDPPPLLAFRPDLLVVVPPPEPPDPPDPPDCLSGLFTSFISLWHLCSDLEPTLVQGFNFGVLGVVSCSFMPFGGFLCVFLQCFTAVCSSWYQISVIIWIELWFSPPLSFPQYEVVKFSMQLGFGFPLPQYEALSFRLPQYEVVKFSMPLRFGFPLPQYEALTFRLPQYEVLVRNLMPILSPDSVLLVWVQLISPRFVSRVLISPPSVFSNCRLVSRIASFIQWKCVPCLVTFAFMNAWVNYKASVFTLPWMWFDNLCHVYSFVEFYVLSFSPFGGNNCNVGKKIFSGVGRRLTLSSYRDMGWCFSNVIEVPLFDGYGRHHHVPFAFLAEGLGMKTSSEAKDGSALATLDASRVELPSSLLSLCLRLSFCCCCSFLIYAAIMLVASFVRLAHCSLLYLLLMEITLV